MNARMWMWIAGLAASPMLGFAQQTGAADAEAAATAASPPTASQPADGSFSLINPQLRKILHDSAVSYSPAPVLPGTMERPAAPARSTPPASTTITRRAASVFWITDAEVQRRIDSALDADGIALRTAGTAPWIRISPSAFPRAGRAAISPLADYVDCDTFDCFGRTRDGRLQDIRIGEHGSGIDGRSSAPSPCNLGNGANCDRITRRNIVDATPKPRRK